MPTRASLTGVSLLAMGLALLLTACGNGNMQIRFVNTSPGEASLDYALDGTTVASGVSYGTSSNYDSTFSGSRHLQVYPSGTTNAIIDQTINLSSSTDYSLVAINYSFQISSILMTDDNSTSSSGNAKVRVLNASPGLGTVDVYVVAPGTDLNTISPTVSGLAFEATSSYLVESAGSWQVTFTSPGQKIALLSSGTLTLASGQIRTVIALNRESGAYTTAVLHDMN